MTFEDFGNIPYILKKADAILIYPGSDLPPNYYNENVEKSHIHNDSFSTFLFNKALLD